MQLRDTVEEAVRRWDALERSHGEAPVIDFDCAPPVDKPRPFDNRFAALDLLTRLRVEANAQHQPLLSAYLDAHIAYLCALMGQQLPFGESLRRAVQRPWRCFVKPTGARLLQANSTNSGQPAQSLEGTSKLFVYGTLLLDDVVSILINRIPRYLVAKAPGWRIVRLPQKVYPGLVPDQGDAKGKVFTDLTDAEWATLDAFEDPAYTLAAVRVWLHSKWTPSPTSGKANT